MFKEIAEAINIITSKERLKQVLTTRLYSNALYLMLDTLVIGLMGFVFWMVVARFYTDADVGFGSAIISALFVIALLSLVGLDFSLIRFLPNTDKPQELINTCFTLGGLISLAAAGIFVAGLDLWSPALGFIKGNAIFLSAFIIFTLLWTLSNLIDFTFIAKRRAEFTLSKNSIYSVLRIPLSILLVTFFHSFGIVASLGLAIAVAIAISLFFFLPKVQSLYKLVPTLNLNLTKGVWRYSSGSYLVSLFSNAPTLVLPLIVVNRLGAESNAYFYITWMIAYLLFAIPITISQSLFAEGSHFGDKLQENIGKSLKFTFVLLVPAVVLCVLVGKWLLLLFGESYSVNALHLLQILAISSLPLSINYIYTGVLRVKDRLKELAVIWGFISVTVLLVSYLVIPATGITGIGYVWLGTNCVVAVYSLIALLVTSRH